MNDSGGYQDPVGIEGAKSARTSGLILSDLGLVIVLIAFAVNILSCFLASIKDWRALLVILFVLLLVDSIFIFYLRSKIKKIDNRYHVDYVDKILLGVKLLLFTAMILAIIVVAVYFYFK